MTSEVLKFSSNNQKIKALAAWIVSGDWKNWPMPVEVEAALDTVKHKSQVYCLDLPCGHTCPAASICKSKVNRDTGKVTHYGTVPCYATKAESAYPSVRRLRWHNFDILRAQKNVDDMANTIEQSLPKNAKVVRIHSSGDFFNKVYFLAWVEVARRRQDIVFFGYTKILEYVNYPATNNFHLTFSHGSKFDTAYNGQPTCHIVTSDWTLCPGDTAIGDTATGSATVPIICNGVEFDDFVYIVNKQSFGLLEH